MSNQPVDDKNGTATAEKATSARVDHETLGLSFEVPTGSTILEAALEQGIELDHGCGVGVCGACACEVYEGLDHVGATDPIEQDALERYDLNPPIRLACRARLTGPVKLRSLPE
jgi:ferredoxin